MVFEMNYEQKWGVGYNLNVNKEEKLVLIKKKKSSAD